MTGRSASSLRRRTAAMRAARYRAPRRARRIRACLHRAAPFSTDLRAGGARRLSISSPRPSRTPLPLTRPRAVQARRDRARSRARGRRPTSIACADAGTGGSNGAASIRSARRDHQGRQRLVARRRMAGCGREALRRRPARLPSAGVEGGSRTGERRRSERLRSRWRTIGAGRRQVRGAQRAGALGIGGTRRAARRA